MTERATAESIAAEPAAERLLFLVGNAHIDPVWLWQWPEGLHEVRATFASALDRMEEYEDFVFTCDSVAYLDWVEKVEPELFERIRHRVAEGRFVVVGGWWIEPDCNVPSGESFVRQALYAQRFLWDRFAITATVGCNVDPFGHAGTIPQLLAKAGMDAYLFLRPEPKEKALPAELFWWATPDGSRVLAYRIPYGYTSPGTPIDSFLEHALERAPATERQLMILYGVGNHGGGPTRANLDSIARLDAADNGLRLRLSSPRQFFDAMAGRDDLPTYVGDLQHHAVGCYSAHSGIKRWNRRAEHLLVSAERLAAVAAAVAGAPSATERLAEAWKLVCFNQFHDTLAGTAIAPAYEDARDQYGYASSIAADVANLAAQSIGRMIEIPPEEGTIPILVLNPLPWPVRADVELELEATSSDLVTATDEATGRPAAVQSITSLATVSGRHRRLALAADLPALGYRLYRLRPDPGTGASGPASTTAGEAAGTARSRPQVLENEHLRVEIDPETGWLSSFVDKLRDHDLAGSGAHAVVVDDRSDTWGHDVSSYDEVIGRFFPLAIRRLEDGPVRSVVEVESGFGDSRLIERFVLGARSRQLEVRVTLDWHERQRLLKLRFPSALEEATATFSIPYGHLERPTRGTEEPSQAWVDVSGKLASGAAAGWSLLNDAKHGHDVRDGEIGMTAARSPVYAWHDPCELDPGARYEYLDQGRQDFTYALVPHGGHFAHAGVVRLAEELNERPFALPEHFHAGTLEPAGCFADDGGGAVVLAVLKQAEDGESFVVRAYETSGRPAEATLELGFLERRIESRFAPGEIRTFLVPGKTGPIREVSLLEWPAESAAPSDGR